MENLKKNPLSLQLNVEDFAPASNEEKKSLVIMRESVNFWKDGMRRLKKNKIAMVSLVVILLIAFMAYVLPSLWPYSYEQQIKGSNNLAPFAYSAAEQAKIDAGEKVFPHILGTDRMGRDFAVRVMMGTRVSLSVGLLASVLVLLIGATYGAISAFAGGWVDNIMMRITDILYTIPDILLIILLAMAIKEPLETLATKPGFGWMQTLGPNMVSIFIIFALLYWVGMARIVRSQVLTLKESEYVTAARALGASGGRIIKKHLLTNCMGTLMVTTALQIRVVDYENWTNISTLLGEKKENTQKASNEKFRLFWDDYHNILQLPKENIAKAQRIWKKLSEKEQQLAIDKVEDYYFHQTNINYLLHAASYLSNKAFLNEY